MPHKRQSRNASTSCGNRFDWHPRDASRPRRRTVEPNSHRPNALNDYAQKLIKIKVGQLARRRDFRGTDSDDLAQDMRLHLLRRAHHFDPARSSYSTYVARVIDAWIATMLRDRRRRKRAAGLDAQSLEATSVTQDGAPGSLRDVLHQEQVVGRIAIGPDDEATRRELIAAVTRIVESLPTPLPDICARLPDQSHAAIRDELGLSRRQFDNAMALLRKTFEDAGLATFGFGGHVKRKRRT